MKKQSVGSVLAEIVEVLEAKGTPNRALLKRAKSALAEARDAKQAATAGGRSGRPAKFDRTAIGSAEGTLQEVAAQFGCSTAMVTLCRKEVQWYRD